MTDSQLRQSVTTKVERNFITNPLGDSGMDDVEAAFVAANMRTADLVVPPLE